MDDSTLEIAEATQAAIVKNRIELVSKDAVPTIPLTPKQFKRLDCVACGEDLERFRLELGRITCIHCQMIKERAEKR